MNWHRSPDRRTVLGGVAAVFAFAATARADERVAVHVVKGTGCECCVAWADYLAAEDFDVTQEERYGMLLIHFKIEMGVPQRLTTCHTGVVGQYFLEGHVPATDIRRLVAEQPDALGLAVAGMPYGSPGMGPEDKREAYDVLLVRSDGSTEIYSSYPEA